MKNKNVIEDYIYLKKIKKGTQNEYPILKY